MMDGCGKWNGEGCLLGLWLVKHIGQGWEGLERMVDRWVGGIDGVEGCRQGIV